MQASRHYLKVARGIKQFEDDLYRNWADKLGDQLSNLLKRSILAKPLVPVALCASTVQTPLPGDSRSSSRVADFSHILPPGTNSLSASVLLHNITVDSVKHRSPLNFSCSGAS